MIAGCIDKMRHDACGGCERRDACASLFSGLFGPHGAFTRQREAPPAPRPAQRPNPLLAFLGQVARSIEAKAKEKPSPFRQDVEGRIEALLETGSVRINQVARDLGLSRQTLYRRLKAEGVTFEQLLEAVRRRLALRFVREQGMPVKEAAWRLGFSDPAAFSRAYKRWTGTSPRGRRH